MFIFFLSDGEDVNYTYMMYTVHLQSNFSKNLWLELIILYILIFKLTPNFSNFSSLSLHLKLYFYLRLILYHSCSNSFCFVKNFQTIPIILILKIFVSKISLHPSSVAKLFNAANLVRSLKLSITIATILSVSHFPSILAGIKSLASFSPSCSCL